MILPINTVITDWNETVDLRIQKTERSIIAQIGFIDQEDDVEFMQKCIYDELNPKLKTYIYTDDHESLNLYDSEGVLWYRFVFD